MVASCPAPTGHRVVLPLPTCKPTAITLRKHPSSWLRPTLPTSVARVHLVVVVLAGVLFLATYRPPIHIVRLRVMTAWPSTGSKSRTRISQKWGVPAPPLSQPCNVSLEMSYGHTKTSAPGGLL